jgi:hypothetical protein
MILITDCLMGGVLRWLPLTEKGARNLKPKLDESSDLADADG